MLLKSIVCRLSNSTTLAKRLKVDTRWTYFIYLCTYCMSIIEIAQMANVHENDTYELVAY